MQQTCLPPSKMVTAGPDDLLGAYVQGDDLVVKFGDLREAKVPLDFEIKELEITTCGLFANGVNILPKLLDYLINTNFFIVQSKLYKRVRESVVSNKEAKSLIRAGKVFVNDVKIIDPNTLIIQTDYVEVKDVAL